MRHEIGDFAGRGGVRLFWQRWLPEGAPRAVVVNLHGLGDHSGLYVALVEHLVDGGFAVHAFDQRGHGHSAGQRAYIESWADFREDLDTFLGAVRRDSPSLPVFLIGNSLGGLVVLEYALTRSDGLNGVVAVSPPLGRVGVPPILMALGRVMSRIWPRFSLEAHMDLGNLSRDPLAAAELINDPLFHRQGTARLSTEVTAAIARVQTGADSLRVPVLLLHGGDDRMVPPDGTRKFFAALGAPDRTYHEYPGAYHALFADLDAARVLADLSAWMTARM